MVHIQTAGFEDLESWSQMRKQLWPSATLAEHRSELQEFLGYSESFRAWIGIDENRPIGFAEASLRPFANGCEGRPVVFIEGIWVDPNYRHKGIGRLFVSEIEQWATSLGLSEVGSDVELANLDSQQCHQRWGFEETERVVYYRKRLR